MSKMVENASRMRNSIITHTASPGTKPLSILNALCTSLLLWFVAGRSQSCSSNYFLLIITASILCLWFYATT